MQNEELQVEVPAEDAEQTEVIAEVEDSEPESSTELVETDEEPEVKQPRGVQKRLNELTANWREEQRRAQKLEAMLEQVLSRNQMPEKPEVKAEPAAEPKLEQFQTYEEYVGALADYRAELKVQQKLSEMEQRQKAVEAARQKSQVVEQFQSKASTFAVEHPDFNDVAFNPELPVTDSMAEAIQQSDNGPELLYHLGKNPSEAARIAALTPLMAAVELGKLAVKVSLPQPRNKTAAPPPIRPLSGGSGTASPDPDKKSADEWLEWRRQQIK
jgi:predicted TIM-barrel fold metal-dependent hydrolase